VICWPCRLRPQTNFSAGQCANRPSLTPLPPLSGSFLDRDLFESLQPPVHRPFPSVLGQSPLKIIRPFLPNPQMSFSIIFYWVTFLDFLFYGFSLSIFCPSNLVLRFRRPSPLSRALLFGSYLNGNLVDLVQSAHAAAGPPSEYEMTFTPIGWKPILANRFFNPT